MKYLILCKNGNYLCHSRFDPERPWNDCYWLDHQPEATRFDSFVAAMAVADYWDGLALSIVPETAVSSGPAH